MELKNSTKGAVSMYLIALLVVFLVIGAAGCFNYAYRTHESVYTIAGIAILAVDVVVGIVLHKKWNKKYDKDDEKK